MSTEPLDLVEQAARAAKEARATLLMAIRMAHESGESERAIGRAASLSGPRIHQILKETA